jgi:stage II sporulation protein R
MKLKKWEIGLTVSLVLLVVTCGIPVYQQGRLADKLTRLHVVANSDAAEDQTLKLQVRDAVLAEIRPEDRPEDPALLLRLQTAAEKAVEENGAKQTVRVYRTRMFFDTRVYDTFSLPAGMYDAVRVELGAAKGRNWWCVLFPPLCAGACQEDLTEIGVGAGLTEHEISYISGKGTNYMIRFKIAEWWGNLCKWVADM